MKVTENDAEAFVLDQISSPSTSCYACESPLAAPRVGAASSTGARTTTTAVVSARVEVDVVSISAAGAQASAASTSDVRSALRDLVKGVRREVRDLLRTDSLDDETKQQVRELFRDFRKEAQSAFREFRRNSEEPAAATSLDNAVLEGFYRFKSELRVALAPPSPAPSPIPAVGPVVNGEAPAPSVELEGLVKVVEPVEPAEAEAASQQGAQPVDEKIYDIVATFERAYYAFKDQLTSFVNSLTPSEPAPIAVDPLPEVWPGAPEPEGAPGAGGQPTNTAFAYTRTTLSIEVSVGAYSWAA